MHARLTYTQLVSGKSDEAVAIWHDKVAPVLKQKKGFKGAYLLGDREAGKGVTITLWETQADAEAVNAALPEIFALFAGLFAAQPTVEELDVLLQV